MYFIFINERLPKDLITKLSMRANHYYVLQFSTRGLICGTPCTLVLNICHLLFLFISSYIHIIDHFLPSILPPNYFFSAGRRLRILKQNIFTSHLVGEHISWFFQHLHKYKN